MHLADAASHAVLVELEAHASELLRPLSGARVMAVIFDALVVARWILLEHCIAVATCRKQHLIYGIAPMVRSIFIIFIRSRRPSVYLC